MKNLIKLSVSAIALTGGALVAAPAMAQDAPTVSAEIFIVSDYRFRGVSLSNGAPAVQGGIELGWDTGFYAGTWASSIETFTGNEIELDFYAGFANELANGLSYDLGLLFYTATGGGGSDWEDSIVPEIYASIGGEAGLASWSLGVAYLPEIWNTPDDNIWIGLDAELPFGDSPFYGFAGIGYESGWWGDDKIDWTLGIGTSVIGLELSLAYVGFDDNTLGDDHAIVFSIGSSW